MDKKKGLLDKLKALKGKEIIIAIIAVVIMLVIYFSSSSPKSESAQNVEYDYILSTQNKITSLVQSLSGDDRAEVAITWECSAEKIIAYSETTNSNGTTKTPTIIQSQSGNSAILLKTIYPKAKSVAVVVKNGNEVKLRLSVQQMLSTLLEIEPDKVAVYSSKK